MLHIVSGPGFYFPPGSDFYLSLKGKKKSLGMVPERETCLGILFLRVQRATRLYALAISVLFLCRNQISYFCLACRIKFPGKYQ